MAAVPATLKKLQPFIARAQECEAGGSPQFLKLALYCRFAAVDAGIKLLPTLSPEEAGVAGGFLTDLMAQIEDGKARCGVTNIPDPDDVAMVEKYALSIFAAADKDDRAGAAGKETIKKYQAASSIIDVVRQLGFGSEKVAQIAIYAKKRALDIFTALKAGQRPAPPDGAGDAFMDVDAELAALGGGGGGIPALPSPPTGFGASAPPGHASGYGAALSGAPSGPGGMGMGMAAGGRGDVVLSGGHAGGDEAMPQAGAGGPGSPYAQMGQAQQGYGGPDPAGPGAYPVGLPYGGQAQGAPVGFPGAYGGSQQQAPGGPGLGIRSPQDGGFGYGQGPAAGAGASPHPMSPAAGGYGMGQPGASSGSSGGSAAAPAAAPGGGGWFGGSGKSSVPSTTMKDAQEYAKFAVAALREGSADRALHFLSSAMNTLAPGSARQM